MLNRVEHEKSFINLEPDPYQPMQCSVLSQLTEPSALHVHHPHSSMAGNKSPAT